MCFLQNSRIFVLFQFYVYFKPTPNMSKNKLQLSQLKITSFLTSKGARKIIGGEGSETTDFFESIRDESADGALGACQDVITVNPDRCMPTI